MDSCYWWEGMDVSSPRFAEILRSDIISNSASPYEIKSLIRACSSDRALLDILVDRFSGSADLWYYVCTNGCAGFALEKIVELGLPLEVFLKAARSAFPYGEGFLEKVSQDTWGLTDSLDRVFESLGPAKFFEMFNSCWETFGGLNFPAGLMFASSVEHFKLFLELGSKEWVSSTFSQAGYHDISSVAPASVVSVLKLGNSWAASFYVVNNLPELLDDGFAVSWLRSVFEKTYKPDSGIFFFKGFERVFPDYRSLLCQLVPAEVDLSKGLFDNLVKGDLINSDETLTAFCLHFETFDGIVDAVGAAKFFGSCVVDDIGSSDSQSRLFSALLSKADNRGLFLDFVVDGLIKKPLLPLFLPLDSSGSTSEDLLGVKACYFFNHPNFYLTANTAALLADVVESVKDINLFTTLVKDFTGTLGELVQICSEV